MAGEVEVARLIARLEGDASGYLESLRETERATKKWADAQEAALKEGRALTMSLRTPLEVYQAELRKAQDLLKQGAISTQTFERANARAAGQFQAATAGAAAGAGQLNQQLERAGRAAVASASALRSMEGALDSPAQAAGALGQALAAIPGPVAAIAGAAVGVGAAIFAWVTNTEKARQELERVRQGAENLFGQITQGGMDLQSAFTRARAEDFLAAFRQFREGGTVQQFIQRFTAIQSGAGATQTALAELNQVFLQGRSVIEHLRFDAAADRARVLTRDIRDQTAQVGLSANAAQRLQLVQQLAAEAGLTHAEAARRLAGQLAALALAQGQLSARQREQQALQTFRQTEQALTDEIGVLQHGADAWQLMQLRMQGVSEEQIKIIRLQQEHRNWMRSNQALAETFAAVAADAARLVKTPLEQFQDQLFYINQLWVIGALEVEEYERAVAAAVETLEKATPPPQQQTGAAALVAGSAEAISAINRWQRQQQGAESPEQRVERVLGRLEQLERQQLEENRRTTAAVNNIGLGTVTIPR
jgi:hypothetical protein